MTTKINKRGIPPPRDASNRQTIEALVTSVNELSGSVGLNMQRAVRVCELIDAGIMVLDVDGVVTPGDKYVRVTGDDMTGNLRIAGDLRVTPVGTNRLRVVNTAGVLNLHSVNAAESAFTPLEIRASTATIVAGATLVLAAGGSTLSSGLTVPQLVASSGDGNPALSSYLGAIRTIGSFGGGIVMQDSTYSVRQWLDNNGARFNMGYSNNGGGLIGSPWMTVSATGATATAFTPTSDRRRKEDIEPHVARPLARLMQLHTFRWRDTKLPGLSVMAQDVRGYAPEYVVVGPDGVMAVDKDGLTMEAVVSLQQQLDQLRSDFETHRGAQ